MDVYAVAGGDGAGKTATASNLAVALRETGSYAAVLDADLSGNVASMLDADPEDARTRALEPVFFAVPESPAANAYSRLADSTRSRDGTSAVTGATADGGRSAATAQASGDAPSTGQPVDGTEAAADDGDDDGGFLSGLRPVVPPPRYTTVFQPPDRSSSHAMSRL
jgi:hypothetical protein